MVDIDPVGDRSSALQLKNIKDGKYHRVFNYYNTYNRLELLNETVIVWPGGTETAPIGRPKCGFDNEFCPTDAEKDRKFLLLRFVNRLRFRASDLNVVGSNPGSNDL